jgi:hypothetical protein
MSFIRLQYPAITEAYLSAFDCMVQPVKAIYCSSELTSGRRWYEVLRQHSVKNSSDLKRKLGEADYQLCYQRNMDANKAWAERFAAIVRHSQSGGTDVINPGPLTVPGWGQDEYNALWEQLIRTRVREVRFNRNWQFSNGCTFEFTVAFDAGIPRLDSEGEELDTYAAVALIREAVAGLEKEGFDIEKLQRNADSLESLLNFVPADQPDSRIDAR